MYYCNRDTASADQGEFRLELGLAASYGRLWALLAQRHLKKKDLQRLTSLSPSVIAKLGRNETVHLETLLKICTALKCGLGDIVEIVPKENEQMANYMKTAIKSTFLSLLEQKPLNQITVKMVVEECGINRNSFYYYYQDLPALIEEAVQEEAARIMNEYPSIDSIETALNAAVDFTSNHRRAILHIYNSVNREIFEKYLWKVCDYVVSTYGESVLKGREINDFDRWLIGHFYKCECFGLIIAWLNDHMKTDVHIHISRICELHRGMIEEMIQRSSDS